METVLYILAGVSTAFFLIRVILLFVGMDGADHADISGDLHDAASAADFKVLTLLTAVITLMIGSWTALLLLSLDVAPVLSLGGGYAIGFALAIVVAYMMFMFRKLEHDGAIRDFEPEGLKGTVYVRIPEAGKGKGQVQISVQGRLRTFDAVSDGPEIDSFKPVVVMSRMDKSTLRVCPSE